MEYVLVYEIICFKIKYNFNPFNALLVIYYVAIIKQNEFRIMKTALFKQENSAHCICKKGFPL